MAKQARKVESSGIFSKLSIPLSDPEAWEVMRDGVRSLTDFEFVLGKVERVATEVLESFLDGKPQTADEKNLNADARELLSYARSVHALTAQGDATGAAIWAFRLGTAWQRLQIRWAERHVRHVKKKTEAIRDGHKAIEHPPEAIDQALKLFDSLRIAKPRRKISSIELEVQRLTGIPGRTLRYHLKKRATKR